MLKGYFTFKKTFGHFGHFGQLLASGVTRKKNGVFIESIMVKMEFEVTMDLYGKGACLIK